MKKHIKRHIHKKLHKHVDTHGLKHIHKISHHVHKCHHTLLHAWELILVWMIWFMGLMFASGSNLPNNNSFSYPLQKVSTLECRTLYRNDMPDSCKIDLPIIHWANYSAYEDNSLYRSIYTALWAAPYSDSWNQKIWAHAWLDIATARGTPLYSIWDGEVYFAWRNSAYGNVLKIKYVYQWEIVYAIYAHMDNIIVKNWDVVSKWQKVWTVWNSWNTFWKLWWYHVHFEIDKDNYGRPAYSYTNCPDLSKWHYKIIQNWLCRNELFTYQYDPIRIFESNSTYVFTPEDEEDKNIKENNEENFDETEETEEDSLWLEDLEKDISDSEIDKWNEVINNNTDSNNHNSAEDSNNKSDNISNEISGSIIEEDVEEENIEEDVEEENIEEENTEESLEEENIEEDIEEENTEEDPYLLELDFEWITPLAEHFTKLWDIEIRSELKERSLLLWETLSLDIEIFKKWQSNNKDWNWFKWILQIPFLMITSNDKIEIDVSYLQLITKWKAKVEITWKKAWKSNLIIEFGWKKIWILDVIVK